jgi:hypothetical protein
MIVYDDGTCIFFGTDDATDYLARHGVSAYRIDDFAELLNRDDNIAVVREAIDSDLLAYALQYDEICCIVDDILASIDAALSKQRITGARELLRTIRDTLGDMTGR